MSNVELIAAALGAGATAVGAGAATGLSNATTRAVDDAYRALKHLLRPWVRGSARMALDRDTTDARAWADQLGDELIASGADVDPEILAAAEDLLDRAGSASKYNVAIENAHGVQIGDHNKQKNYFGATPPRGVARNSH